MNPICVFCSYRWTYNDFFSRYRVLMRKSDMSCPDKKLVCQKLLETLIKVRSYKKKRASLTLTNPR